MSFSILYFQIYFLFLYLFKLFEHSKYMIIYKSENLSNVDSLPNFKFLKFHKLQVFWFSNFRIFQIGHFWHFPNSQFLRMYKQF